MILKEHRSFCNLKIKEKKNYNLFQTVDKVNVVNSLFLITLFFFFFTLRVGGFKMFNFSDHFFNKIEKKTNVGKDTIMDLAKKLQQNDLKNEGTLREVIQELGKMTGKEVSKEKEDKIVAAIVNDKVPKNIDKMF